MRTRSRLAAVGVALLPLIAACGDDDSGDTASGDETSEESAELSGSLRVAGSTSRTGEGSFLALAAAAFEEEHPGVDVRLEGAELSHLSQTLPAQISTGQAPDIISTTTSWGLPISALNLALNDQMVDLTDQDWVARLPESLKEQLSYDGEVYSMPTDLLSVGIHYDPAIFERDGLTVPTTYDDLLGLCETAIDNGTIAMSLAAGEPYLHQNFLALGLLSSEVDANEFVDQIEAGETTFSESDGWLRAFEKLREMNEASCFGDNPLGVTREAAEQRFATGDAYMMGSYSLGQARIEELNQTAEFKLFSFPADTAEESRVAQGPTIGLAIPKSGKNVELAKAFVAFTADHSEKFAAESEGAAVPVVVADPDNPPPLPSYLSELDPIINEGRTTLLYAWEDPDVLTAYDTGVASILQGSSQPEDVLEAMDEAWEAGS